MLFKIYASAPTGKFVYYHVHPLLFSGQGLSNNLDALDRHDYLYLGRLVAITLLQGGAGLPVFSRPMASYILTGKTNPLKAEDFPETARPLVQKV